MIAFCHFVVVGVRHEPTHADAVPVIPVLDFDNHGHLTVVVDKAKRSVISRMFLLNI